VRPCVHIYYKIYSDRHAAYIIFFNGGDDYEIKKKIIDCKQWDHALAVPPSRLAYRYLLVFISLSQWWWYYYTRHRSLKHLSDSQFVTSRTSGVIINTKLLYRRFSVFKYTYIYIIFIQTIIPTPATNALRGLDYIMCRLYMSHTWHVLTCLYEIVCSALKRYGAPGLRDEDSEKKEKRLKFAHLKMGFLKCILVAFSHSKI